MTQGNTGGNPPTLPTPPPKHDDSCDDSDPIDLRFEFEELRVLLDLTDRPEIRVDDEGRFEIRELLGRGAMGAVYHADDNELGRDIAIKVVGAVAAGQDQLQDRLLQEARALAQLSHPNVVQVHDVRIALSGERIIALEYVEGSPLRRWQETQSFDGLLDAYLDAARGLAAAHDVGVVHRDFKPDNAIYDEKKHRVVVVDFGLAGGVIGDERLGGPLSPIESTGLGTPQYMAPEQHLHPADARCDQYAFCVALWEAIDGKRPFAQRPGPADELPPAPPRMPAWLFRVLRKGLAWDPDDRFPSMHALIDALERGRRRAKRIRVAGIIGTLLSIAVVIWIAKKPQPCADASAPIDEVWNADTRAEIEQAFAKLDAPWSSRARAHALATLDAVSSVWSREATSVCKAELREGQTPALDRRRSCLDGWLDRIAGTVKQLRAGDEQTGTDLLAELDPLVRDQDLCSLPPPVFEPAIQRLVAESEKLAARRELTRALTEADRAVALATKADPCTPRSNRSYAAAAAHFQRGYVLTQLERWPESKQALRTATDHALGCQDAWTLFDIRTIEAFVYSRAEALDLSLAQRNLDDASSLLLPTTGLSAANVRRAELARMSGLVAAAGPAPDHELALAELHRARGMLAQLEIQPVGMTVKLLHNIGSTSRAAGREDEAEAAYAEALEVLADTLGRQHPDTLRAQAGIEVNRGLIALKAEQYDLARARLEFAAIHGSPPDAARAYSGWIQAEMQAKQIDAAASVARDFDRWLDGRRGELPELVLAKSLTTLGQALMQASVNDDDYAIDDEQTFERGVVCVRTALELWPQNLPERTLARYVLASSLYDGGRFDEASALVRTLLDDAELAEGLRNRVLSLQEIIEKNRERSPSDPNMDH